MNSISKTDVDKIFGKILRDFRIKNNLTQENVAELSGLAPRYISQIERGELKGIINTLLTFCNTYKITPNDILINFLDADNFSSKNSYDYKINQLSIRDKEIIDDLLNFLSNH